MKDYKNHGIIVLCVIVIALLGIIGIDKYNEIQERAAHKPIIMTQQQAEDDNTVRKMVNDKTNAHIDDYQAHTITHTITRIVERDIKPDTVVQTTGADYQAKAKYYATESNADATIITPAKGEKAKVADIKPTDKVVLNQYNIKAYPKHLCTVSKYSDGDITASYQTKVSVFGAKGYVGPTVKYDADKSKVVAGVTVTVPF